MDPATALHPEELAAAKAYMTVEDDDDLVVMDCVMRARAYLSNAGVALPPAGSLRRFQYDGVCHGLALTFYEQRRSHEAADVRENPFWRNELNQLKLTEPPVSNSDTGAAGGEGDHGEEFDGGKTADSGTDIPPVPSEG